MSEERPRERIEVNINNVHDPRVTPLRAPRRGFWDFAPEWLVLFCWKRWGFPKTTPYERWIINNACMRQFYAALLEMIRVYEAMMTRPTGAQPGKKIPPSELN